MKKSERFLFCMLLAVISSFMVSTQAMATHAQNVDELSNLLPGDARGALAVDINALSGGGSEVTDLLAGNGTDPALNEPFVAINTLVKISIRAA
jgi:hypothetical protein